MNQSSDTGGGNLWDDNSGALPPQANMSLQLPMTYDSRRLFPFGLSPIPEVPSELASEVSSVAGYSPTPSLDDLDTETESIISRGSIMYSGSCDSIQSIRTLHGKNSESESSTGSDHDTIEDDEETEGECCEEYRVESIPSDSPGPKNSRLNEILESEFEKKEETYYSSQVTQMMHQKTFLNSPEQTKAAQGEVFDEITKSTEFDRESASHSSGLDLVSGAATASQIFRHLQATRGKQEVTTELAKILNVLKTTLEVKNSSSSEDESPNVRVFETKNQDPGKPPKAPKKKKMKPRSSISPAILSRINELENSKSHNPKEEMNLLSKILVHLLCSCKSTAVSEELKRIIRQFKEVAKVAIGEDEQSGDYTISHSKPLSRNSRRKVRSRTASGNSNNSGNSETDSLNTLTPGNTDPKSSETDDEGGEDINKSRFRFNVAVTEIEPCVTYTLTLPSKKPEMVSTIDSMALVNENKTAQEDNDYDDEEWEYEDELGEKSVTPNNSNRDLENDYISSYEAKSDTSAGRTNKILTEMEDDESLVDHAETDYDMKKNDKRKHKVSEKGEVNGHLFCHLEETFKVLLDTYEKITTGGSTDESEVVHDINKVSGDNVPDRSFEDILDGVSTQCVQLESEFLRSSPHFTAATPEAPKSQNDSANIPSRPTSKCASRMSRPGSRIVRKTPIGHGESEEDWGDEDEWEYYYEDDEPQENPAMEENRPISKCASRMSRPASRIAMEESRPNSKCASRMSRPASRIVRKTPVSHGENEEDWGDEDEWEYYYEEDEEPDNHDPSRPSSRIYKVACTPISKENSEDNQKVSVALRDGVEVRVPSRVASRQEKGENQRASAMGQSTHSADQQRIPSRIYSRPPTGTSGKIESDKVGNEECDDDEWEYYYEDDLPPESRKSSRPNSRASSRPVTRNSSRMKVATSTLINLDEEDDRYYDDDDDEEDIELLKYSPTATTAPTTRATSPFPDEKGMIEPQRGTGFSQRKISTIMEEQSPVPSVVKTPTLAPLPAEFLEDNKVMVKEKREKKYHKNTSKTGSIDYEKEESDGKKKRQKKKKGDGKFLPKIGVRDLVHKLEPQLFQDTQVGTKLVMSKDEARDVIRESKKNTHLKDIYRDINKDASGKDKDVEKRKSVREMVQFMSSQTSVSDNLEETKKAECIDSRKPVHLNYNIPSISASSNAPPIPPPPQGFYTSHNQYQQFPQQCTPQYVPPRYQQGSQNPYQQYPPEQQYQQYQQLYQSYQPYPPSLGPQHYQQYSKQYQQQPQSYSQQSHSYSMCNLPYSQQQIHYQTESNPNQMKVVSSGGQTTFVNMRQKNLGAKQKETRPKHNKSMENIQHSPEDSEAYGTGSTGSESQDGGIEHDNTGDQEQDVKPHKRHSRLFKLLQDSDYTDSDTDSRCGRESDIESVCSGIERKHSFRSHKSSNKESDNESIASSGMETKISPSTIQKNLATRRFMHLNLQSCYEPSSSELSTPNSPTAAGPDLDWRRRSTSKHPARVFSYLPDEFDSHAGISDDSSYQSLQSLNSFDSFVDSVAGHEVEEILKRKTGKMSRDNLYRYQTDSPSAYVRASPKSVELLRGSPKTSSPKLDAYSRASPKLEQELMELTNFPTTPYLSLRKPQ